MAVGMGQRIGHRDQDRERLGRAQPAILAQPIGQRAAGDVAPDRQRESVVMNELVARDNVGVLELGGDPGLPPKPLAILY